jgi:hypothetical protein
MSVVYSHCHIFAVFNPMALFFLFHCNHLISTTFASRLFVHLGILGTLWAATLLTQVCACSLELSLTHCTLDSLCTTDKVLVLSFFFPLQFHKGCSAISLDVSLRRNCSLLPFFSCNHSTKITVERWGQV